MTDLRKKIAAIVADERKGGDPFDIADAIIAALPDMVPDLVWEGFKAGPYELIVKDGGSADLICHAFRDGDDEPEYLQCGFLSLISMDEFKSIANTHHRAQIMAALGVK